jgi:hypothetical protein
MFTLKEKTRSLIAPDSPNLFHKVILILLGATAFNIMLSLALFATVSTISSSQQPSYVVDEAGNRYPVKVAKLSETTPDELKSFVGTTMFDLFDWRGKIKGEKGKPDEVDPGIKVKTARGSKAIATSAWASGFRLSDPFRAEFLKTLAALTPQSIFSGRGDQGFFVLELIDPPEKIKDGWRVRIQGRLMLFLSGDNVGRAIALKYDVFVRERNGLRPIDQKKQLKVAATEADKVKHLDLTDLQRLVLENNERFTIYAMREF